jgi:hypothetical protein
MPAQPIFRPIASIEMAGPATNPATAEAPAKVDSGTGPEADAWAGADAGAVASDRSFEFSLRLLTVVVLVALVGSTGLLAYRVIAPRFSEPGSGPVKFTSARPKPAPSADNAGPAKGDEVLMDPGHVFRCEEQGRVTFSDRACTEGAKAP